jgi:predicted ATPase/class 3 adenylate cyclase
VTRQPSGTVTFLLSDIEGSTRLLRRLGTQRYAQALDDHRNLLRQAFARHAGYEVDYEGDAFVVAFQLAGDALAAAREAQGALLAHHGPEGEDVRVRMGIHSGEPLLAPPKYVGLDLHQAARIMSAGHGGQVLVSATAALLAGADDLHELGEHRLKDFPEPVSIFQLGDATFPPLKTISNTNLPHATSSFVGRGRELGEIRELLLDGEVRLLTLTGAGGTGKTRLALEAAASLVGDYLGGVFWVGLGSLRDPALVTATIAQTLGAKDSLAEHIGEREFLLVLDNLEQVIESAPELSVLLERCANLTMVVTSRELLQVQGEHQYAVPPLEDVEAVALFCERAATVPSDEIAELCAHLDALPLAVELAAARARILSPAQILERLSQRLDLLRGGRDSDPRQLTLRTTIEWSHELLSPEQQGLFARLSVFAGGSTLEAAEAVCNADVEVLQPLVEKSLLRHVNERFWMLETIRDFAGERLETSDEADSVQLAHGEWFTALAERAAKELFGTEQVEWLGRLERDHDNLRAALTWAYGVDRIDLALRLTAALRAFWFMHGHIDEGRRWFVLAVRGADASELRARVLGGACVFAAKQGDVARARELAAEGLALCRTIGDARGTAMLLRDSGAAAALAGDYDEARRFYEEGARLFRELGERGLLASMVANLGDLASREGDLAQAAERTQEALELQRELGEMYGVAISLHNLGFVALRVRRYDDAEEALHESMRLAHDLGYADSLASSFEGLAAVAVSRERWRPATRLLGRAEAIRALGGGVV